MDYLFDQFVIVLHCLAFTLWGFKYLTPHLNPRTLTNGVLPTRALTPSESTHGELTPCRALTLGLFTFWNRKAIVWLLCSELVLFLPWFYDILDLSVAAIIACVWILIFYVTTSEPQILIKHGAIFKPGKVYQMKVLYPSSSHQPPYIQTYKTIRPSNFQNAHQQKSNPSSEVDITNR